MPEKVPNPHVGKLIEDTLDNANKEIEDRLEIVKAASTRIIETLATEHPVTLFHEALLIEAVNSALRSHATDETTVKFPADFRKAAITAFTQKVENFSTYEPHFMTEETAAALIKKYAERLV